MPASEACVWQILAKGGPAHLPSLKRQLKNSLRIQDKLLILEKLQSLPRNSAPSRLRNRCSLTGRPRSNYRDFGFSRHVLREMAHTCVLPKIRRETILW
ncbi:hypothetical protein KP509_23G000200 [Ceratopteris richardii]|uniref:Ribosomal protein S14 n=1 Tax=Ceratopteris richardii TaxID=49495 RepID=A0A8T2RWV9_CERRI|nr:hypothetical protein KP509_23G000200 [Ceratopteris richardii]